MIYPNNSIINKIDKNRISSSNDNSISILKKNALVDSISDLQYSKKIIHTDCKNFNSLNSNLIEMKKNFNLEKNEQTNHIQLTENNKKNNVVTKYSKKRSKSLIESSLIRGKSLKSKLKSVNGNSLTFNFSVLEIICKPFFKLCRNSKRKFKLYEKAYNSIDNHFHIYSNLKVIQEVDTMKNTLFSIDETKIIDFISKPTISEEDKQEVLINEDLRKNKLVYEQNLDEVLKVYEKILNKKEIKDNTKNLIKFLSLELEKFK